MSDNIKEKSEEYVKEFVSESSAHAKEVIKGDEEVDEALEKIDRHMQEKALNDVAETVKKSAGKNLNGSVVPYISEGVDHIVNIALGYEDAESAAMQFGEHIVHDTVSGLADKVTEKVPVLQSETSQKYIAEGVEHTVNVIMGHESAEEAIVQIGGQMLEEQIENVLEKELPKVLGIGKSELMQIIEVGTIIAESASKLIDGEITAEEFVLEIGDKGATMVAQMIGGEVGAVVGEIIGASFGGLLGAGVGDVIGRAIGTMIATVACNAVIAIRKNIVGTLKSLDDYRLHEQAIHKLEVEAIAEMEYQRQKFRAIVEQEYKKWDENIEAGFDMIMTSACEEVYNLKGITDGLDRILSVFGKSVMFKNLDEYEEQLDLPLKLSF